MNDEKKRVTKLAALFVLWILDMHSTSFDNNIKQGNKIIRWYFTTKIKIMYEEVTSCCYWLSDWWSRSVLDVSIKSFLKIVTPAFNFSCRKTNKYSSSYSYCVKSQYGPQELNVIAQFIFLRHEFETANH
jgi:hypothetical protein